MSLHKIRILSVLVVAMLVAATGLRAQNVSVSPTTGNMVAESTQETEVGFDNGYSSMWIHNQLLLSLTTSDQTTLTSNGLLSLHAGNMIVSPQNPDYITIVGTGNAYFTLSLPKGYRFSGYTLIMQDRYASGVSPSETRGDLTTYRNRWTFTETDSTFQNDIDEAGSVSISSRRPSMTTDYQMSRRSSAMGNVLYFHLSGGSTNRYGGLAALCIKQLTVTYEADGAFTESVAPAAAFGEARSVAEAAFNTGELDLGPISSNTKTTQSGGTVTRYSYQWANVKDLSASALLYSADAAPDGVADPTQGTKNIYGVSDGSKRWFGLKTGTYFVETPVEAAAQGDVKVPLAYRITAAKLHYKYADSYQEETGYLIRATSAGTNYYLGADGTFSATDPDHATLWTLTPSGSGYIVSAKSGGQTIYLTDKGWISADFATTTSSSDATAFTFNNGRLSTRYWASYYISRAEGGSIGSTTNTAFAATVYSYSRPIIGEKNGSAVPFTISAYDKTGKQIAETQSAGADNAEGTIELTGLNNDAVKFSITIADGAADDALALVSVDLTCEALNPYVDSYSINATPTDGGEEQQVTQHFLADGFETGGDDATFDVPDALSGYTLDITFSDLHSKHADDTYGPDFSNTGNGRYHFVESDYFNAVAEQPYAHADIVADYDYTKKISVAVAGDKPFRFNNADELGGDQSSTTTNYLQQYEFSLSAYQAAGGQFGSVTLSSDDVGKTRTVYLFTKDETRYNIAPTTQTVHQKFAFYQSNILLREKAYTPKLTFEKIYDTTFHATATSEGTIDETPFVGVTVGVLEELASGEKGYLTARAIADALADSISAKAEGAPADMRHVIYIDCSQLSNVVMGGADFGNIAEIHAEAAPNSLIYLPAGSLITSEDNTAYLDYTANGQEYFKATRNILVEDKQPFYAPYEINIDQTRYARYRRLVITKYGRAEYSTIMLPFTIKDLSGGVHTDSHGSLQLLKMNSSYSIAKSDKGEYDATAFFSAATDRTIAEANTPYAVRLVNNAETEDGVHFTIDQAGATIAATPSTNALFSASAVESAGSIDDTRFTFSQKGTFTGCTLDKVASPTFYFGRANFVSSLNLSGNYKAVKVLPFRSVFEYTTAGGYAKLQNLYIQIGENPEAITAIGEVPTAGKAGCRISGGRGCITISAAAPARFTVRTADGATVESFQLAAGETRNIPAERGIYIVNNVKVAVR